MRVPISIQISVGDADIQCCLILNLRRGFSNVSDVSKVDAIVQKLTEDELEGWTLEECFDYLDGSGNSIDTLQQCFVSTYDLTRPVALKIANAVDKKRRELSSAAQSRLLTPIASHALGDLRLGSAGPSSRASEVSSAR